MVDSFKGYIDAPDHPARNFYTVVPSDVADLPFVPKGVICSAAGNLVLVGENGAAAVTIAVNANTVYPFSPQRIKSTGHTAGTVVALH